MGFINLKLTLIRPLTKAAAPRPSQPADAPKERRKAVVFAQDGMSQPQAKRLLPEGCTISKEKEWHHRWKLKWAESPALNLTVPFNTAAECNEALKHILVYAWSIHKHTTGQDCPWQFDSEILPP